jgi:hypothetical protein
MRFRAAEIYREGNLNKFTNGKQTVRGLLNNSDKNYKISVSDYSKFINGKRNEIEYAKKLELMKDHEHLGVKSDWLYYGDKYEDITIQNTVRPAWLVPHIKVVESCYNMVSDHISGGRGKNGYPLDYFSIIGDWTFLFFYHGESLVKRYTSNIYYLSEFFNAMSKVVKQRVEIKIMMHDLIDIGEFLKHHVYKMRAPVRLPDVDPVLG